MRNSKREAAALTFETAELLRKLGTTIEDVAATLGSTGVRGIPRSGTGCVLARYVHAVMGPDPRLRAITVTCAAITMTRRRWWLQPVVVSVPPPVQQFIVRFDRWEFSELVAEPGGARATSSPEPPLPSKWTPADFTLQLERTPFWPVVPAEALPQWPRRQSRTPT
jgi:hypothetical protein